MPSRDQLGEEADIFIKACYGELNKSVSETKDRLSEVRREIEERGVYTHTYEELAHGARMAWRNSNRCIGRLPWNTLKAFDARQAQTEEDMAALLFEHLRVGYNQGKIRPCITIFSPAHPDGPIRLWNQQLIRYAGYRTDDGVVGDPASVALTEACLRLGWRGQGTPYDILPLVIRIGDKAPRWFELPRELVVEVPIRHPELDWFEELRLRWYAMPFICDMLLDIGGISYTAAPFNAWYMGTEIAARNLADPGRYNVLPRLARRMGLDTSTHATLWKDRALVELNLAVLLSYQEDGISMVDHHTASDQFKRFEHNEKQRNRTVTGEWSWLIPPVSPATTHMYHKDYDNSVRKPGFFRQPSALP
ncbi:nitric oxide synthase oxygenase [Paenibacillus puerhi]|uniref:nitric oxide synthase oxygenase n=1 Tax=Paenibacillus puerhi TaxID=2692622 RepID=UPI00135CD1C3|nr:nitric oxide synthase oxygenase [Paenibacillus puerhi]